MCVYSFAADFYYDKWNNPPYKYPDPVPPAITPYVPLPGWPPSVAPVTKPAIRPLTPEAVDDLRELLRRASEYDKKNNQPECETQDKIERLKKLILELAPETDLSFLDEEKK